MFSTNSTLKTTEKKVPYVRTKQGPKPMPPKPGTFKPPGYTGKPQAPPKRVSLCPSHHTSSLMINSDGYGDEASRRDH